MAAWAALFQKDFRLTRTVFFTGLVINLLSVVFAYFVGIYPFIPMLAAGVIHVFYFPIMLFASMRTEAGQMHRWLHNPRPAMLLLLSKLASVLATTLVSLAVLYVMAGVLPWSRFSLVEAYWTDLWRAGWLIFLHIVLVSAALGAWVLLLWSLHHALKYWIGRWTWLVLPAVAVVVWWLSGLVQSTPLYAWLTHWGRMEMGFPAFSMEPITVFAGEYAYHLLIFAGLVYVSAWIIDRKVEV